MIDNNPVPISPEIERIASIIVDAAYTVHITLGPGLLESVYEICLAHELEKRGLVVRKQVPVSVIYDGIRIQAAYEVDILVQDAIILELKSVEKLLPIHTSQLLTYMRLAHKRLGFLINFNVPQIRDGIKRNIL